MQLDGYDKDLLESFQALSPLLFQASEYKRSPDEERENKRLMGALRLIAQLVLHHDRQLQQVAKQDSFVLYIGNHAQGAMPMLTLLASEWKKQLTTTPASPPPQTLRTYLFQGLVKELNQRVGKISKSGHEDTLWTTAIQNGSWPYLKWNPDEKRMVEASKAPLTMSRLLKEVQYLEELLAESHHIIRFQSLRPQQDVTPWQLQLSLRDEEVWRIMGLLTQSTVWTLMGMQVKFHNLQLSKPAMTLQQWLGATPSPKGQGKGLQKGKTKKQR